MPDKPNIEDLGPRSNTHINKNLCLFFAREVECPLCEEHCPTGKKAIVFEEKDVEVAGEAHRVKFPRTVKELCVGCGICETKCPLDGVSAVRVINEGESRRRREGWTETI